MISDNYSKLNKWLTGLNPISVLYYMTSRSERDTNSASAGTSSQTVKRLERDKPDLMCTDESLLNLTHTHTLCCTAVLTFFISHSEARTSSRINYHNVLRVNTLSFWDTVIYGAKCYTTDQFLARCCQICCLLNKTKSLLWHLYVSFDTFVSLLRMNMRFCHESVV